MIMEKCKKYHKYHHKVVNDKSIRLCVDCGEPEDVVTISGEILSCDMYYCCGYIKTKNGIWYVDLSPEKAREMFDNIGLNATLTGTIIKGLSENGIYVLSSTLKINTGKQND